MPYRRRASRAQGAATGTPIPTSRASTAMPIPRTVFGFFRSGGFVTVSVLLGFLMFSRFLALFFDFV